MIAVITTDPKTYELFRVQHGIDARHAKMIARKSDLDGTVFDEVIDLDPKSNVTDWVRYRIKTKVMEEN